MTDHTRPDPRDGDMLDIRVGVCPVCRWPVGDIGGHVAIAHPDDEPYDGWRGDEDFGVFAARREREMYDYYEARRRQRARFGWLLFAALLVVLAVVCVTLLLGGGR